MCSEYARIGGVPLIAWNSEHKKCPTYPETLPLWGGGDWDAIAAFREKARMYEHVKWIPDDVRVG